MHYFAVLFVLIFSVFDIANGAEYEKLESDSSLHLYAFDQPTYTDDIAPLFKTHCVNCHNTMAMIPDFSKYEPAYKLRDKILQRAYVLKNMPPGNMTKMTDAERALVAEWVETGAAE